MARKKSKPLDAEFVMFDVVYADGSRRSNRRVPTALLGGLDGDEPARDAIMEQDRLIAEKSGMPPLEIVTLERSGTKPVESRLANSVELAGRTVALQPIGTILQYLRTWI